MHHAVRVGERHGIEHAAERVQAIGEARVLRDEIVEPAALDQLHHVEGAAVGQLAGIVNGHDARMIEAGEDVGLPLEAGRARAFLIGDIEHFHRDVAIEHVVSRHVDGAHAAAAGHTGDFVAGIELRPRRRLAQPIDRAVGDQRLPPSSFAASASHSSSLEVSSRSRSSTMARNCRRIAARWLVTVAAVRPSARAISA